MKNTGRIFIIINYFLLILSILIIFQCFSKKNSLLIISLFLIIQIADVSAGLKERVHFFAPSKEIALKDQIWKNLFQDHKILKTKPDYALLLAWNFSKEIIKNNVKYLNCGGKFIIPIPNVKIISKRK